MRKIQLTIFIILLAFGCTKTPEKDDIEELANKIGNDLCGNLIQNEGEDCDFYGIKACSEYNSEMIGPLKCKDCRINIAGCVNKNSCFVTECSGNASCVESNNHEIKCECNTGYSGSDCSFCDVGYHFDLDVITCIDDSICTEIGCGNERKYCYISNQKAYCECTAYFTGASCDVCKDNSHYYKDGECFPRYCENSGLTCLEDYEVCDDSAGYPRCECASANQDPEDCTKCKEGYDWVTMFFNEQHCNNYKYTECISDPNKSENSEEIIEKVKINYSEENGWETPAYCAWECDRGTYYENDLCNLINIKSIDIDITATVTNKNGDLILFSDNGIIYKLVDMELIQIIDSSIHFNDARILPDGNYLFIAYDWQTKEIYLYITTPDGKEIEKKTIGTTSTYSSLTFSNKGKIYYGDIDCSFSENKKIHPNITESKESVTLTDSEGDIYTVIIDGNIYSTQADGNPKWMKNFSETTLSKYSALSQDGRLYVPFLDNLKNGGFYIINTVNGEIIKKVDLGTLDDKPSLSIGNDFIYCATNKDITKGSFLKISKDGVVQKEVEIGNDFSYPPFVLDSGKVLARYGGIFSFDYDLNIIWQRSCSSKWASHYKNMLIVDDLYFYYALGKPQGDWPQHLHDSMRSGSLEEIEFIDPPKAPEIVSPSDNTVSKTNEITFTWKIDSENPDIKYTLLLREPGKGDKVYAGPETNLNAVNLAGLKESIYYEWRVVSQSPKGALNVSKTYTFRIEQE